MLTLLATLSLLYWIAVAVVTVKTLMGVKGVPPQPPLETSPKLSLVIAARNEEDRVEAALRSKLDDSYPNLEFVFVDDRSTDATGRIARRIAKTDARLRVLQVTTLPPGWLGKVHAMQRGLEASTGDWVLFSDADVHIASGMLERIVAYAEEHALDHVAVLPRVDSRGLALIPTITAFFRVVVMGGRLWNVPRADSSAAAGVGAFNLVRRRQLERSPGLEWLRMEVSDDMALGVMLKRTGGRSQVFSGRDFVSLEFYSSYRALALSVEKNGATAPFPVLLFANLLLVLLEGGFLAGHPVLLVMTWALATLSMLLQAKWLGLPKWPAAIPPLGMLLLAAAMVRSAILAFARGGVIWRGTFYATREIRAGSRLGLVPTRSNPTEAPRAAG